MKLSIMMLGAACAQDSKKSGALTTAAKMEDMMAHVGRLDCTWLSFTCAAGVARVLWLLIGRIENSLMGRSSIILLVESPKMDNPEDGRPHGA